MASILTAEEKELIELFYKDNTPISTIARELNRSPQTIRNHLDRIGVHKITRKNEEVNEEVKKEVKKEEQKKKQEKGKIRNFHINRGEIYFVVKTPRKMLTEQEAGRPAIIISNNKNNLFSDYVEVVYLTTQERPPLPTHVTILSSGKKSTALCEQIYTIPKERLAEYYNTCTVAEMAEIDAALCVSLDINPKIVSTQTETKSEPQSECFDEMIKMFGQNVVADYCRCRYFFHMFNNNMDAAKKYMDVLVNSARCEEGK